MTVMIIINDYMIKLIIINDYMIKLNNKMINDYKLIYKLI